MYTILSLIAVITAFLLVIVVLLQSSKGGGLAGITGGPGGIGQMFGSRRTADFLSRTTWWLGSIVLGLAVLINLFFLPGQTTTEQRESIIQSGNQIQQSVPDQPALPQQQIPDQSDEGGNSQDQSTDDGQQ